MASSSSPSMGSGGWFVVGWLFRVVRSSLIDILARQSGSQADYKVAFRCRGGADLLWPCELS